MAGIKEYVKYDALGLADLVKKKKVSAAELVEEAITRIEEGNPKINAVIHKMYDIGRKAAKAKLPDGPFSGVPFLLKDLLDAYAGVPLTGGSRAYKDFVPKQDSELVARYKKAGLVVIGKTNLPEFGLVAYTEPDLFGPCRNPWNLDHTPGGSSGGSAAAIAAGFMPMASGGDGGGSIRIPSACCALFGLKPSRGRNPTGPEYGALWQGATVGHVLSRSVRDSAVMLDAVCGADPGAPYVIAPPERPYALEMRSDPGKLRIAFSTESPVKKGVDKECIAAVKNTAKLLSGLGHKVEEATPPVDFFPLAISYFTMYLGEMAADLMLIKKTLGRRAAKKEVELVTRTLALLGRAVTAGEFVSVMREWDRAARVMGTFFEKYDLYLTPTMARPPVKIGELKPKPAEVVLMKIVNGLGAGKLLKATGIVEQLAVDNLAATPFTQLSNLTGLPAMSVPLHWTTDGLPCGVHFTAPFGEEARLLRLAAQLEKAAPWFDRRAPGW
jgi:amidase